MSRTTIILVSILGVVAIGGGVFLWLNKDNLKNPLAKNTNTTNATVVTNAITNQAVAANVNLSTTQVFKGDKTQDKTLTVAGVSLHLSSSLKATTFEGVTAPSDQQFLVIYFDPIQAGSVPVVQHALVTTAHLITGKGDVNAIGVKVATTAVKNDLGYLKFLVPANASGIALEVGSGSDAQHAILGY